MRIKLKTLQNIILESLDNAYNVLGIEPGASPEQIRAAWRALVLQARSDREAGIGHGFESPLISHYNLAAQALISDPNNPEFEGYDENSPSITPPRERVAKAPSEEPLPDDIKKGRKTKDSYKVYPWKDNRKVIRVGGNLYGTGPQGGLDDGQTTKFNKGDRAGVAFDPDDDGRVTVSSDSHSQKWNTVDEVRKLIDEVIIEMMIRA